MKIHILILLSFDFTQKKIKSFQANTYVSRLQKIEKLYEPGGDLSAHRETQTQPAATSTATNTDASQ